MIDFLLVIPAFEESERLPPYLEALGDELASAGLDARLLIVDDGSREAGRRRLLDAISPLSARFPAILPPLVLPANQGKGGAIMAGWSSAPTARFLAFADADGAVPPSEITRVFRLALDARDSRTCFFASRVKMLGRTVERHLSRHLIGRVYASLVGMLVHSEVYDSQCGFKVVAAEAWPSLERMLRERRFAFDVELLAALVELGFPIQEVPIDWRDVSGSKVSLMRDSVRMLWSLWRIRSNQRRWKAHATALNLEPRPEGAR